jgi:hypothetical protein
MADVDPEDDSIRRFIVWHYRFDPQRHERRNVLVAAFDNEREMWARMEDIAAAIRQRLEAGDEAARRERTSGSGYEPGYLRKAAFGHLVSRAMRHGVFPHQLSENELASNMTVSRKEPPSTDDDQRAAQPDNCSGQ